MKPTKQVVQCAHMTLVPPLYRGYGDSDHPLDKEGYEINNLVKDIAELVRYTTSAHAQMCWDFDVTCSLVVLLCIHGSVVVTHSCKMAANTLDVSDYMQ